MLRVVSVDAEVLCGHRTCNDVDDFGPVRLEDPAVIARVRLLGDLLAKAQSLREVTLGAFQLCISIDQRIPGALASMHQLEELTLHMICDSTFTALRGLKFSSLHSFTVIYAHSSCRIQNVHYPSPKSVVPLVEMLPSCPRLQSLQIHGLLGLGQDQRAEDTAIKFRLPSITRLHLVTCSSAVLDIANIFPNLAEVQYWLHPHREQKRDPRNIRVGPRWPSISETAHSLHTFP
ncbi:hypothetical protein C8Q80DRAFT_612367 [Daedaleopsis nitida]|nr:hypothetical protein C8Q80DRAFT_612367 [Daedaleopsis nitida]